MRKKWYFLATLVLLMLTIFVGLGCLYTSPKAINTALFKGPYQIHVHWDGRELKQYELEAGSVEEQAIDNWLASHAEGWKLSFTSYVPQKVIRGHGFNLNLLPDGLCVLNDEKSNSSQQLIRQLSKQDVEILFAATESGH